MRPLWIAICAGLLALALGAPVASAAEPPGHQPLQPIEPPPPSPVPPPPPPPLKNACGVAVDSTERVFVSSYYGQAIYVFGPKKPGEKREFETMIQLKEPPTPAGKSVGGPCDLAVDSKGNLYVNNWHYNVIKLPRLTVSPPSFGPPVVIDANESTSVTVDAADHVFVDDRTYVAEYDSAGAPVMDGGEPVRIGLGSLGDGYGVAVSGFKGNSDFPATEGRVYVADAADNTVKVYNPSGGLMAPVNGGGTPRLGFTHLVDSDLAVDPVDGHLYVVDNFQPFFEEPEAVVLEFSSLGHFRGTVPDKVTSGHASEVIDGEPSAVTIFEHDVYLTSGNYFDDNVEPKHPPSKVLVFGPTANVQTGILTVTKTGAGAGTVFSSSPAGLGCGSACEGEFTQGQTVVLAAAPAAHNRFVGWTGCTPLAATPSQCQLEMGTKSEVSAEFEPIPQRHLTLARSGAGAGTISSAPAGIACGATCEGDFDEGSTVTLTATPGPHSTLAGWTGCDSEPGPGKCAIAMSAARSVVATFDPVTEPPPPPPPPPGQRILSVLATATGGATGTVTSEPGGIDCGGTCARTYREGDTVTLVARPAAHSRLLGWGGCDRAVGERCTVTLGSDKTVVAAFGPGSPGPLRVQGVAVRGDAATLRLALPTAGTLTARGRGLRPAEALPLVPGRFSLGLRLDDAGRRALAKAGRGGLAIKVALALAPFDGGSVVRAKQSVVFGGKGGGRRR